MDYSTDTLLNNEFLLIILAVIIGAFLIAALFVNFFIPFREERDYIKKEMSRTFKEEDYLYWKRELRDLYLSSIPLIGKFFR